MAVMEYCWSGATAVSMPRSQAPMLQNANIEVGLDYGLEYGLKFGLMRSSMLTISY